jgi:transcriptional regulator GlxA family with amidase domain
VRRNIPEPVQVAQSTTLPIRQRYQHIVDRFEEVARARLGELNRISDICAAIAVSERTLERAFQAIYGITASRHLHAVRLAEARKALLSAGSEAENVTQIATRFGFYELGRFAGEYRAAFGESPSETARRGRRGRAACPQGDGA